LFVEFLESGTFMSAWVRKDGTVCMGFPGKWREWVEVVSDPDFGEIRPPTTFTEESDRDFKISFHPTGEYKLHAKMGKPTESSDRVTIVGPRFGEIASPRRMVEILLPRTLAAMSCEPSGADIIFEPKNQPQTPLRCTVICMDRRHFEDLTRPFVDDSIWEAENALESDTLVWVWVLRASRQDEIYPDYLRVFLYGKPKWGTVTGQTA
jgi:hypothetical protein